jgi:quercetin dioxygenase-like cupin family protein
VRALADPAPKPPLRSSVFEWKDFKVETTKTGSRRACLDARTATLDRLESHVTTLDPGQSPHPPHKHPEEELVIVKEGTLEALQNDRTTRVSAGGMIFQASNALHGLKNVGTTPAVYYVVKWVSPGMPASPPAAPSPTK